MKIPLYFPFPTFPEKAYVTKGTVTMEGVGREKSPWNKLR